MGDVMTTKRLAAFGVTVLTFARIGAAQPPRPTDSTRIATLTISEYNRLIDLASRPPQGPAAPPVAAVLASADLRVRVERDTARGVFDLAGDVLREGFSRVTVLSGATLVDASAGGRPLPLVSEGGGHTAVLPGPGPFSLTLEWGAPLKYSPGRASFVLPVPPSGTARATFDLPGEQADVRLSPGLITRRSTEGGRTIVEATLDPGAATEVSWSMRDSQPIAAARDVRTLADVMTLVTIDDSDVRLVTLIDLTVVQGEPRTIVVRLPQGYELTSVSGSSIETSEPRDGTVVLTLSDPSARRHQILVSLERPHDSGSFSLDTGVPTLADAGRERGEIAVEGVGTLELTAAEREGMHRIDVKELNTALQSLARLPILSAFRYHRGTGAEPGLALDVKRFADTGVLAAVADHAYATTLVTAEGRALTEVTLTIQNRAQPFLKVTLPAGASIVSVDIEGQPAKPVLGADGVRVPLLRPGFRPKGPYTVSFVYLHAGAPFARKGDLQMTLPKMDIPVGIVEWEMFMPGNYSIRTTGGNVIDRNTPALLSASSFRLGEENQSGQGFGAAVGGGAGSAGSRQPGSVEETVTVTGAAPKVDDANKPVEPSQNVINLQRRAAGVLPVRIDIPRAGTSHQFVRPLVVDQETMVMFHYKRRS